MSVQSMTTIERFNSLPWHDSKLVGLCFYKSDGEDRVKLSLGTHRGGRRFNPGGDDLQGMRIFCGGCLP